MISELRWEMKSALDRFYFKRNMFRLSEYCDRLANSDVEPAPEEIWEQMLRFSRFPSPELWENIPFLKKKARGAIWTYCGAMQDQREWCTFLEMVRAVEPKNVMEIGTADGGSLFGLAHYTQDTLISVDLPRGIHGGGYTPKKRRFYQSFEQLRDNLTIHLLQYDSGDPLTVQCVDSILGEEPLDVLFIDGSHLFDNVVRDFKNYLPFVRDDGLVALHDISAHTWLPECGVGKFWEILSVAFPDNCMPIVFDRRLGLGVLKVSPQMKCWSKSCI